MNDEQARMLHAIGTFHQRLGDPSRALALLAALFEAHPGDTDLAVQLIRCYIDLGEGEAALRLLDGLPPNAGNAETRKALTVTRCQALWLCGRKSEARDLRARALQPTGRAA